MSVPILERTPKKNALAVIYVNETSQSVDQTHEKRKP